jgi:predicted naringenin-chalcone synthase
MGCHGSLNGLRVAHAFVKAQPDAKVLLSSLELCSTHFHYGWDPQKIIANALFADGAASVVLGASDNATKETWKLASSGSCILPDSKDAMTWNIGDHGFEMTLAKQVPGLIKQHLKPWLEQWLAHSGLKLEDVKSWALHPGGPRILTAIEDALSLPANASEISREILSKHGNMSSATLLFILKKMAEIDAPRPCVALGFGPGLAAEAALFI